MQFPNAAIWRISNKIDAPPSYQVMSPIHPTAGGANGNGGMDNNGGLSSPSPSSSARYNIHQFGIGFEIQKQSLNVLPDRPTTASPSRDSLRPKSSSSSSSNRR